MRKLALTIFVFFSLTRAVASQTLTSSVSYATSDRGGTIIETAGVSYPMAVGYARVQASASTTPSGVAIFGFRANGALVTEAGVPGMFTMLSGRTYAEVNGAICGKAVW